MNRVLTAVALLVLCAACREGPTEVDQPLNAPAPLALVAHLTDDPFIRMTIERIGDPAALESLAQALGPLADHPTADQLETAAGALGARLSRLRVVSRAGVGGATTEAADDPEAAILNDALTLLVDDALRIVLAAKDPTGR